MEHKGGLNIRSERSVRAKQTFAKDSIFPFSLTSLFKQRKCRLDDKHKEFFYIELYSMLEAGMDLKKSLDIIIGQQKKVEVKGLFIKIRDNLVNGSAFWETLKESGTFTPYEYYCVQIGEESGNLMTILKEMSLFFGNKLKLKEQLVKSLSYPLVIVISSVLAVGFMMVFIVPMFTDMFARFEGELPVITKFFIRFSDFINDYWLMMVVFWGLVFLVAKRLMKRTSVKNKVQSIYPRIPYLGSLITGIYYARLCSSMSLLISARVPLLDALDMVKRMISYYPIQLAIDKVEKDVIKGCSLHESFAQHKIFDEKNLAIIRVGEEINRLDVFFNKLHQRYLDEVDVKTNALNTFLEPLIIMILGIVIGLILVAMYLPMFQLSTSVGL
jgi:type IV pilus assembly protein PilC